MKNYKLIALIVALGSMQSVLGQKGWRIAVEAGPLFSRTFFSDTITDNLEKKYYTGYRGGLAVNWGKSEATGFSLALNFVDKGIRYERKLNDSANTIAQIKEGTKFLEVPFCMVFKQDLGISGFIRENFGIGAAFQLNKYDSLLTESNTGQLSMYNNRNSNVNAFFRLGFEVGNRFDNGNLFTVGLHYQQGFGTVSSQNFFDPKTVKSLFNTKFNGSYFALTLGYHFNLNNIGNKEEFFTENTPRRIFF